MSRPRCWICFKQLMYVNGTPVFAIYTDGGGVSHQVHKECLKAAQRDDEADRMKRLADLRTRGAA